MQPLVYGAVLRRFGTYLEYDALFAFLKRTGVCDTILPDLEEVLRGTIEQRRTDVTRQLLELPEMPPDFVRDMKEVFEIGLAVTTDSAEWLDLLEKQCARVVESDEYRMGLAEDVAFALLASDRPTLGILVSRAVLLLENDSPSAFLLLEELLRTRDRLNLSPEDPVEDLLDRLLSEAEEEDADGEEHEELLRVRETMRCKEGELRQSKEKLEEARRQLRLSDRHAPEEKTETVPKSEDDELVRELRLEIRGLKQDVKSRHTEKQLLRRELKETQQALGRSETDGDAQTLARRETDLDEREEELFEADVPHAVQPVRIPRFSKQVVEALKKVPESTARRTLKLIGEPCAGEQHAFASVRRLKAKPRFLRARIGRPWRLVFTVDNEHLELQRLINRRDLERTVKTLS
ncbi:MAG: hypothetical protein KAI66_17010, partial [Lentisphaeria bacterium]|nr:hypothetical protein [Lentisphaeria bacterium]